MSENIKKVSKKKILFVQIDEEITHIFERVEKLPYSEVYWWSRKAILLQSSVNLKSSSKTPRLERVALITNDVNGMKLAYHERLKFLTTEYKRMPRK